MSNETKQTAVEWLVKKLDLDNNPFNMKIINQAKKMEKEKQKYFFDCGRQYQLTGEGTFTQVYNETYGNNK